MQPDLSAALAILRREIPDLAAVYLFGSQATDEARPDSDVDLAVLAGSPLAPTCLLNIQETVANALMRDVDLIDLRAVSTVLQMQVIGAGQPIDAPQPGATAHFEVRVMGDYQALKANRAELEADIVRRGRVHA